MGPRPRRGARPRSILDDNNRHYASGQVDCRSRKRVQTGRFRFRDDPSRDPWSHGDKHSLKLTREIDGASNRKNGITLIPLGMLAAIDLQLKNPHMP